MDSNVEFEKMGTLKGPSTGQSSTSVLDEQISSSDDTSLPCSSPITAAPICRQFWKAGNYEATSSKSMLRNSGSYLHINPKFLHSNATSHKWAFGAIAELLDNAIDEIENGATYVIVDKISNPRDGEPALLIQDDGGGMDPEGMRHCLSFGFSDKKSKFAIGHYGNGFKTSSMRLGADVIVFSRCCKGRKLTQSVGLLSYTFLVQTGYERIVVPMVDYEFNVDSGALEILNGEDHFRTNLSLLLQWSPYSSEAEILDQFENMGCHGTKVVIYNLWYTDDGTMELDLDSDPEDIRLSGSAKVSDKDGGESANEKHIAHQLRYSLRVYLSILYLKIPTSFAIHLRGKVVLYHNMGLDLKHPEFIVYRPFTNGIGEGVTTTIGFLKEAPNVDVHGFNIYHKNRLILPFWEVGSRSACRCRGVVGILEANFIVPTHNKQDFERTPVFQKLENRLKDMAVEYWDYHCELLGYYRNPRKPKALNRPSDGASHKSISQPIAPNKNLSTSASTRTTPQLKRKEEYYLPESDMTKRRTTTVDTHINQSVPPAVNLLQDEEAANLMQVNKKLRARQISFERNWNIGNTNVLVCLLKYGCRRKKSAVTQFRNAKQASELSSNRTSSIRLCTGCSERRSSPTSVQSFGAEVQIDVRSNIKDAGFKILAFF